MAVIRKSLDNSHFVSKNSKDLQNVSVVSRELLGNVSLRQTFTKQKKKTKASGIFLTGVAVLLIVLVIVGKGLLANTGLTPIGIGSIIPAIKPKLSTDAEGKTNIMLVGIDTRETGTVELNTDTIILGSYDEKTNRLSMLSYPRDLAVSFPGRTDLVRINSIYAIGEYSKKGTGLEKLREVVELVSGKKIQYYAMVDLKGFIDAIDVIGGIDVYLENNISGLYPAENYQYTRISFERGWNTMDGKSALEYSRIRKDVVPASESSDFSRAKRQQKVIQAVIDKVSKTETLQDAKKVFELLGVISKNLKMSKVAVEDLQAGVNLLKEKGKPTSFTYVLDLYAGGDLGELIDVIDVNPYLVGSVLGANNWTDIQKFTRLYFTEPMLATMKKAVLIYTDGTAEVATKATSIKKQYYYADIVISANATPGLHTKGFVYATGGKQYEQVAQFFAAQLGLTFKAEIPEELNIIDKKEFSVVAVF